MTSRVFVEGLVLPARVGIRPDEQGRTQDIRLDVELEVESHAPAAASEQIDDTIDYTRVVEVAREVIAERHFPLVETLARRIAGALLDALPHARAVELSLSKLGCLDEADAAGVRLRCEAGAEGLRRVGLEEALAERHDVVVVGGGAAGLSAALWVERLGHHALIVDGSQQLGGQLNMVYLPMPDVPGAAPQTGPSFARRLVSHVARGGTRWLVWRAGSLRAADDGALVELADDRWLRGRTLIVATGLRRNTLDVPGERELAGRGMLPTASRDIEHLDGKHVLVVGGGDSACENASLLATVARRVTLVHRGDRLRARQQLREVVARQRRIDTRLRTRVARFIGERRLEAAELVDDDGASERLAVDAALVRVGWRPNVEGLPATWLDERGFVAADADGRVAGERCVFAAGDVLGPANLSVASAMGSAANAARRACDLIEQALRDGQAADDGAAPGDSCGDSSR